MAIHPLHLLLAVAFPCLNLAIQVTPNSPCASKCIDSSTLDVSDPNSSNTVASDIECDDVDFTSTSNGTKWKQCMTCLQSSTFEYDGESDQYWFLYNLRYSFDYCVFGFPNGTGSGSNPCETSFACGQLKTALEYGNLSTTSTEFGYCDADGGSVTGEYYDSCLDCVSSSGDTQYVANALVGLEAGCEQRPSSTSVLGLSGSVFSTKIVDIVNPASLKGSSNSVHLSTGAIAGIVVGGIVFILVVAACIFIRRRKRKNRARVGMEPRWGRTHKTHKRKSSFSFRCRNILASPISPKFFRDDPSSAHHAQQYGSLDEMTSSQVSGITGDEQPAGKRYYIDSKPRSQRFAYEPAWSPQYAPPSFQSFGAPPETVEEGLDREGHTATPGKGNLSEKAPLNINTALVPPQPAHQSPKGDAFRVLKSINQPLPQAQPLRSASYTSTDSRATASSQSQTSTTKPKGKTTTISSQGNGYSAASPSIKQKSGWPSPREESNGWFPPPPPPGLKSSSSSLRYGRKSSTGSMKRMRRESGSPVESNQIQLSFPGPPQR